MSRFRFVFVVFCLAAACIFTVYLRTIENQTFYKLCLLDSEINRLKQELGGKQLRLESLLNPAAVSDRVDK